MKSKQNAFLLLLALANADENKSQNEDSFLEDMGAQLELSNEELQSLKATSNYLKIVVPVDERERMNMLYQLLFLMRIDSQISTKEIELIHQIALKFGFNPNMTNDMIDVMLNHINKNIPINLLLDNVKKYMN